MNREEHGKARAGKITGTLAHTVMYGGPKAWANAITNLWADDGSKYAEATTGARAYGLDHEAVGASLFWEHHPEFDIWDGGFHNYQGDIKEFRGMLGVSPDRLLAQNGKIVAGLEIKSPTGPQHIPYHAPTGTDETSNPHYPQIQHGMLVMDLPIWWQVVHYKRTYINFIVHRNEDWLAKYTKRLHAFIAQYEGSKPQPRRRLRITDDE